MLNYKLLLPALIGLTGCIQQGSYHEIDSVYFSETGQSITTSRNGDYQYSTPVNGIAIINGNDVGISIKTSTPTYHYRDTYPSNHLTTYQSGNSSITRGNVVIPSGCTKTITRHGKSQIYNIPCHSLRNR